MILIDYNAIAIGNVIMQNVPPDENLIRHLILNTIRMYHKRYRKDYGKTIICSDAGGCWRYKYFEQYKAKRVEDRKESSMDWDKLFNIITKVRDEIRDSLPWKVIHIHGCEADDVIASMVEYTQEFGNYEEVMIVSADKDFAQLQKYNNVHQFSTNTKKKIVEKNPREYLFAHICRGDAGDGVPNIFSPDDFFLRDDLGRQKPVTQKKLDMWYEHYPNNLKEVMNDETYRNFQRNQRIVDLDFTPDDLRSDVINSYENQENVPNSKVVPYLLSKKCRRLVEIAGDFL